MNNLSLSDLLEADSNLSPGRNEESCAEKMLTLGLCVEVLDVSSEGLLHSSWSYRGQIADGQS